MLAVVSVAAICLGLRNVYQTIRRVTSFNASQFVASMCIEHMKANGDTWPSNWEALRDDYAICLGRSGRDLDFDDLQHFVEIDFAADPHHPPSTSPASLQPEFRFLRSRYGQPSHGPNQSPDASIQTYLQSVSMHRGEGEEAG
ncbi:hypothetical protein [Rosistilla ulvae]|uniref:hypothetical protein n=1 Tax=Rosistilla ulvae TaxID=1930277 RepID=UPI0011AAF7C8|nr:hypothetical protein [Rosistilla ulvae]